MNRFNIDHNSFIVDKHDLTDLTGFCRQPRDSFLSSEKYVF
jgi:hypothetical protein